MLTRVVNVDAGEDFDILIDRQSLYGNPFRAGKREDNIKNFRDWLYSPDQVKLRRQILLEMPGKRLGCHCHPKPCHGDVFIEYLTNEAMSYCWCRDLPYSMLKQVSADIFKVECPIRKTWFSFCIKADELMIAGMDAGK